MELLRSRWRIVLWLLVASSGCAASSEQFVGLWRNTNEERFAEIELRRDGSFTSFSRNNAIIAVVPLQEKFGTWQIRRRTADSLRDRSLLEEALAKASETNRGREQHYADQGRQTLRYV